MALEAASHASGDARADHHCAYITIATVLAGDPNKLSQKALRTYANGMMAPAA
ncbi:hypothetical protein [Aquidulcibacter sp.]|uniref:hypothetical protein n=1 Tax=Aquidulcibacter sp. TaxID=2052990 RepID=UPI003BA52309